MGRSYLVLSKTLDRVIANGFAYAEDAAKYAEDFLAKSDSYETLYIAETSYKIELKIQKPEAIVSAIDEDKGPTMKYAKRDGHWKPTPQPAPLPQYETRRQFNSEVEDL